VLTDKQRQGMLGCTDLHGSTVVPDLLAAVALTNTLYKHARTVTTPSRSYL
jgi:hypothetical protein